MRSSRLSAPLSEQGKLEHDSVFLMASLKRQVDYSVIVFG